MSYKKFFGITDFFNRLYKSVASLSPARLLAAIDDSVVGATDDLELSYQLQEFEQSYHDEYKEWLNFCEQRDFTKAADSLIVFLTHKAVSPDVYNVIIADLLPECSAQLRKQNEHRIADLIDLFVINECSKAGFYKYLQTQVSP